MQYAWGPVVLFDEKMYSGTGIVRRWIISVGRTFGNAARREAPVRTGELRAGIHTRTSRIGARRLEEMVISEAPHTLWVIRGTADRRTPGAPLIMSRTRWASGGASAYGEEWRGKGKDRKRVKFRKRGFFLHLPADEDFDGGFFDEVHGQYPNNFFKDAWATTRLKHPSIGAPPMQLRKP